SSIAAVRPRRYKSTMCACPSKPPKLPLVDLAAQRRRLAGRIEAAIAGVLAHGQFVLGPEVGALEQALADHVGVGHAIACANGTDALLLALKAWGIGPGDAVLVPAFTFAAPAEAVALAGATPVLVDVDGGFTLDPESLGEAIAMVRRETRLKARAVIPVDLFGQPARYEDLLPIARMHDLLVLQDAAQSFGARWRGQPVGRQGDAAATSFYPAKPLGAYGDGGAVLTDDDALALRVRSLARHGVDERSGEHVRIGLNSRLDTLQAAILLAKLPALDQERAARAAIAARYAEALAERVRVPHARHDVDPAWSYYTVRVEQRDALALGLAARGIASAVHYRTPLHRLPAYAGFPRTGLPVADALAREVISLPMHADLGRSDQARVIDAISRAVAKKGA
ncbi:MAG: DegT/DnrJ/EryC1/StrS family aminotransferase, partial [Geminicoccales bacterium]